ncbi:hypothetical protein CI109_100303 [Kwoniella shandongensis]|uniref:Uncharacterized protein n=1 Tax=Kwoniella shandongensis TaxID=1734106 RepID=A0A5M6C7Z3_9TREE|nr:uncharacterized protein CI109_001852 [Kwoniella shandongensis]KAA5529912.1 hypothetical protein CI109_001852 [Kwoniella shandongensis]
MIASTLLTTLLLALPSLAFSDKNVHELSRSRARSQHAKRVPEPVDLNVDVSIAKRDSFSGRATFYDVGLGACGGYNVASDYIVAQNSAQYGGGYPGPNCGKSITISYGGKTAVATIQDECPTCPYGGLDMSRSLFNHFASEDVGQFYMSWWYNDGSNNNPEPTTTSTWVAPTSTYTPPTSTYTPPTSTYTPPTSTYVPPTSTYVAPTSTVASTTETSASASITASASISASGSLSASASIISPSSRLADSVIASNATIPEISNSTATGTTGADVPLATQADIRLGNLILFNQAVTFLGNIVVVGAEK